MNLARHSITSANPVHILDARFDADAKIFTASTAQGWAVYRTWPLELVRKRELTDGTLSHVLPLHSTNILFLVGGGRSPRYPPNKVVVWDDKLGKEVAELEFKSQVRGLACRRGWLAVALRRRAVVFEIGVGGGGIKRYAEWETCDNPRGLLALATAPQSTLLAVPGRQTGHVQLIHLPPCPIPVSNNPPTSTQYLSGKPSSVTSTPSKSKSRTTSFTPPAAPLSSTKHRTSVIIAHTSALTSLALPPSGRLFASTSTRGTLLRVWDTASGKLVREFRRGTDKAVIYGIAFRPDEKAVCVWSDKGTIHIFSIGISGTSNRQSSLSPFAPFIPIPRYFESERSYARYRIPVQSSHISLSSTRPAVGSSSLSSAPVTKDVDMPDEERCVVGWVQVQDIGEGDGTSDENIDDGGEWQLIALTYLGGWYRLALPRGGKEHDARMREIGRERSPSGSKAGTSMARHNVRGAAEELMYGSPPRARSRRGSSTSTVKGKERERLGEGAKEKEKEMESTECVLREFRRYGRWDGWG